MTIRNRARLMTATALSLSVALSPILAEFAMAQQANAVLQPDPDWEKDFSAWRAASKAGTVEQYQAYLKAFPEGKFAVMAKTRITQLTAKAEPAKDESQPADTTAKVVPDEPAADDAEAPAEDAATAEAPDEAPAEDDAQASAPAEDDAAEPADDQAAAEAEEEAPAEASQPAKVKIAPQAADPSLAGAPRRDDGKNKDKDEVAEDAGQKPKDDAVAQDEPKEDDGVDAAWMQEYELWKAAVQGNNVDEYSIYLKAYPDGKFAAIAKSRIAALKAAEKPAPDIAEGDEQDDAAPVEAKPKINIKPSQDNAEEQQQADEDVPEDPQAADAEDDAGDPAQAQDNRQQDDQQAVALTEGTPDTEDEAIDEDGHIEIQGRLTSMGYDTAGLDGIFGRRTRDAIAAWQEDNNAPVTGFLSLDQVDLIREQSEPNYADWLKSAAAAAMVVRPQRVIRDEPVVIQKVRPRVVLRDRVVVKPRVVIKRKVGKTCFVNRRGRFVCRRF